MANNIVMSFGNIDQPTSEMATAADLVRDLVAEIGVVDWQAYKAHSNDFLQRLHGSPPFITRDEWRINEIRSPWRWMACVPRRIYAEQTLNLHECVTFDWSFSLQEVCNPLYCDVFNTKNATTRVTEFLAVIGAPLFAKDST